MTAFITGGAGCGKTAELLSRIEAASAHGPVLALVPSAVDPQDLRTRIATDGARVCDVSELAFEMLGDLDPERIDDERAAQLFAIAAAPLLSLEWTEIVDARVDPEVPGLRAPDRFLEAAFRLVRKLRDGCISPEAFLESALRGATGWYSNPPNLAHPDVIAYTKDAYRDSLYADPPELQRQYRREVDLAKVLAKLYRAYLDHPVRRGCLTARDAIALARERAGADPACAERLRARYSAAFVDDAQELTLCELQLLQALYGESLEGVTLCGDPESALTTFRAGARPDRVFTLQGERTECTVQRRSPPAIDAACRHLTGAGAPAIPASEEPVLTLFRASTQRAEADYVADAVVDLLQRNTAPENIAVLFRSVSSVGVYRDALLARNVDVDLGGDAAIFGEIDAIDALALLWSVYDPFRHEYLLRVLSGTTLRLSDHTLYTLCGEPPDPQTPLLNDLPEGEPKRSGRWDAKRDLRLGWNVLHGDRDADLSDLARERLQRFRAMHAQWNAAAASLAPSQLAVRVWNDALAPRGTPGSATQAYQMRTLQRVLDRMRAFEAAHPDAALGEFLEYADEREQNDIAMKPEFAQRAVRMFSIETARGMEFDHVILPNVRAGAFPRWYAPDAFLYSPSQGMIAKENVGEGARAARTAKFSYYMYRMKTREAYNREERRAFVYGLRRARRSVIVTASERASRGAAAPEFLAELQAAHLRGTEDQSDRWRPSHRIYAAT